MPPVTKGLYPRQLIHATFVSVIPIGDFLYARFDYVSSGFFLLFPLAILFSLLMIFRNFVLALLKRISWLEVVLQFLLLVTALAYFMTGQPYLVGRNAQFHYFERGFQQFVRTAHIDSSDELEWIALPRELQESGIRAAHAKRYDDGTILLRVSTGGNGAYVYSSGNSLEAMEDLNRLFPYRWRVSDDWEAVRR